MNLFTPEQLKEQTRPWSEMAEEALKTGQMDRLRFLLGRMSVGHSGLYIGYLNWTTRLAGKILNDFGEPFLNDMLARITAFLMAPYAASFLNGNEKQVFSDLAALWTMQVGRFGFQDETDNEVAFALAPCGSGGRLQLESWYENWPQAYPRMGNGTPVFCRICEHLQQALNRAAGKTIWSVVPDTLRTGFCRMSFIKNTTRGEFLFPPDEGYRLTTPRCAQALKKLDQGHHSILDLIKDQHTEWRPLHDFFCLFVTCIFSAAYKERGITYLRELVWETYVDMFDATTYRMYCIAEDRSLLLQIAHIWHYHQATFRIAEEADRFVFHLDPCGSGGRLFRGEMGGNDGFQYGSDLLCEITDAADITFLRSPYPAYCIHCGATNRDQLDGKPWAFLVDGNVLCRPEGKCLQFLYKKSAKRIAPPHLLSQVGLDAAKTLEKEYVL